MAKKTNYQRGIAPIAIILIIIVILAVGGGTYYYFIKNPETAQLTAANKTSQSEWNKCKNDWSNCKNDWSKCRSKESRTVNWSVKIDYVTAFGGLGAKGYLLGNKSYPVHITWDPETDAGSIRARIKDGDTINLKGNCGGVTLEGEVWVVATE